MSNFILLLKKSALVTLVLAIGLAALPATSASAAGPQVPANPPGNGVRIERAWARAERIFQRQGYLLAKTSDFIARAQTLIDKAKQKGWDTSAIQTALNAFASVIPAAQAAHDPGTAIIASHNGFDANGVMTDRTTAIATVKALGQVLKQTRLAMDGTGKALHEAIKTFRDAHKPAQASTNP
jgi:hypothetical protein